MGGSFMGGFKNKDDKNYDQNWGGFRAEAYEALYDAASELVADR